MFLALPRGAARPRSGPLQAVVLQRQVTNAFSGRREDRIQHRWRRDRDGGFPHTTPEATRGHHDRFHTRHHVHVQNGVGVEVLLFDAAALHGAFAEQRSRQAIDKRAFDLRFNLLRVDGVARVGGGDDAVNLQLTRLLTDTSAQAAT